MTDRKQHVLFLCTGNSARSILGESLLNNLGGGRFVAHSAGSLPVGQVNPLALEEITERGFSIAGLRSKSWDEFSGPDAPAMDFVFTVCDNAAGEACPLWSGRPVSAHWGIPDPAAVEGDRASQKAAFSRACDQLKERIALFMELPVASLGAADLQGALDAIGRISD